MTGTKGRLRRFFPGPAISVKSDRVADSTFREALTQILTQLDVETPVEARPTAFKASTRVHEVRDTENPMFVTQMLTGILHGIGEPAITNRIHKCTRDDVLWKDAFKPWRRSPLWLLVRVGLQTSLMDSCEEAKQRKGYKLYKSFMIFFMSRILQDALQASLPSDTLFIMSAKISRRTLKLGFTDTPAWLCRVHTVVRDVREELDRRWLAVEEEPDPRGTAKYWNPTALNFAKDCQLSLRKLNPYLKNATPGLLTRAPSSSFNPNCPRRPLQSSFELPSLQAVMGGLGEAETEIFLADVELWTADHLGAWLAANIQSVSTCVSLADLLDTYISIALPRYITRPDDFSLMLLTCMDMWVALDRCAVHHIPLLEQYQPPFPSSMFEPLLTPTKAQMERLWSIEEYLGVRQKSAPWPSKLIFESAVGEQSFGVRYFDQSCQHKALRDKIEADAEKQRSQKKAELTEKRRQYNQLIQESKSLNCQYAPRLDYLGRSTWIHDSACRKCDLEWTASRIMIEVHEWPLPEETAAMKSAVFELDAPVEFTRWRDTTYCILIDVCTTVSSKSATRQVIYHLHDYDGLKHFGRSKPGRLQLASSVKPFAKAHYRIREIYTATEENICVPNGLRYRLYDASSQNWTADLLNRCDIRGNCTFTLPEGPFRPLQYALESTHHTSNQVLADQTACTGLNFHEYYHFATLRSGHRLQWRNIARELVSANLDFSREETHTLIVQAIWQAGCRGNEGVYRESHLDLEEEDFSRSLIQALNDVLGTVENNWQGATACRTLVDLAARVLSLSPCPDVLEDCLLFLHRAGEVALQWTRDLNQKLWEAEQDEQRQQLSVQILEAALTCHRTFNVDRQDFPSMMRTEHDLAVFLECSMIINHRCPARTDTLPQPLKKLLSQFRRLNHALEPILRARLWFLSLALDKAVARFWAGYEPDDMWHPLPPPQDRWLTTKTRGEDGLISLPVHYNLLDGSLLVNGLPLSRLPTSYETHASYRRLFGEVITLVHVGIRDIADSYNLSENP